MGMFLECFVVNLLNVGLGDGGLKFWNFFGILGMGSVCEWKLGENCEKNFVCGMFGYEWGKFILLLGCRKFRCVLEIIDFGVLNSICEFV